MSQIAVNALYQKALQLIILPTEKCNFRCTYCYETFEVGKMKRPTIEAIKKLIDARIERQSLDALSLSWFGGEPLLAKEIVAEVSEYAQRHYDNGSLKYFAGDLTTNAYLLDVATLERLVRARQTAFQISLDGFGAGHDATRKYASGKGTFDVIWKNLLAAKRSSLEYQITIRCHLTRENSASMSELTENICREFSGDKRFSIFIKPIENLGGPNKAAINTLDRTRARERVDTMETRLKSAGFSVSAVVEGPESNTGKPTSTGPGTQLQEIESKQAPGSTGSKTPAITSYICYAAKPNSLMIRADGSIGKCTVLLNDPRNKVGTLNPDGTVTMDSALISKMWMRGFVSRDAKELGCPAQGLPKLVQEKPITFASEAAVTAA